MYHRRRTLTARKPKQARTRIDLIAGLPRRFRLVVDRVEHRPFTDADFGLLAQQVIDVLQVVRPMRRPKAAEPR